MIHQYKLLGYNIVLDINSGSVHSVDETAYDMIAEFKKLPRDRLIEKLLAKYAGDPTVTYEELCECYADIEELERRGKLFSPDVLSEHACDLKDRSGEIKALCLHVAHACNLTCDYCFAAQGKFHGKRSLMTFETGKQALDFLIAHSGNRRNLEVDFFGGEPLLNWGVVKELVAYARSREAETGKRFRFTLTTNGVLVDDEVIEFSNREMNNVVMSLDGRPEVHDRLRRTADGRGSYEQILPKFQKFAKARGEKEYYMRGTFTHENTDFTEDILHMAELGFDRLSMEPVVCSPDEPYALTEEDFPVLCEQYERLARLMLERRREGRPLTFYHFMIDLEGGPCAYKRLSGCGSGTEYLAVTPWGELFPCHQFVGNPEYSMGNVWDGVTNNALRDEFKSCNVCSRAECADCWARLYCSGGCAANSLHASGSIKGIYEYGCRLFRKRMECAIMLKVAEAEDAESEA